jgi:predicted N-acetyltransferase YhbS
MKMIEYRHNYPLDPIEICQVFDSSGIRRPTTSLSRIARMFAAPSLTLSAWDDGKLIGICRSLTDYAYCCYLSDLAVSIKYQNLGVGRELVQRTQAIIGDEVSLILLASSEAMEFYPKIGFDLANNAYILRRIR